MSVAELQALVGNDFIKNFQNEMDPIIQPLRKYINAGRPASMGKELWEYAVADSIKGALWCGAGKAISDVSIGSNIGCDVKSIQMKKTETTEASMFQPLSNSETASVHFSNKDKQAIWNLFVDGWIKKVSTVKEYYMLAIFRNQDTFDCSLAGFKVTNLGVKFLDEDCSFTKKSMKVKSLMDPKLADIKVYIGKTRMEIRIKEKIFKDPAYTMEIYKF
jgi:hypothetical protein